MVSSSVNIYSINCMFHRLCGYATSALVFKNITDADINMVESFIKNELMTFVLKKKAKELNESDTSGFVDDDDILMDLVDYYGKLYATQPENFCFQPGDKMLIKELVAHVEGIVNAKGTNSGLSKFKSKKLTRVEKKAKKNQKSKGEIKNTIQNSSLDIVNLDELKSDLIQRVISSLKSHKVDFKFDLDLENDIHENIVDIHVTNGNISGSVRCIICDSENKSKQNKPKKFHYSSGSEWPCWVLSNFTTHLEKTHNLIFHEPEINSPEPEADSAPHMNDPPDDQLDESVVCLDGSVQFAGNSFDNNIVKDALFAQLSNQITLMMSVALKNSESQEEMNFKLNENDTESQPLSVANIPMNGNCLFTAITHQLENKRIHTKQTKSLASKLRADVVTYILENYPKFSHQLRDRAYEFKK